jgi:hypothetical protein
VNRFANISPFENEDSQPLRIRNGWLSFYTLEHQVLAILNCCWPLAIGCWSKENGQQLKASRIKGVAVGT